MPAELSGAFSIDIRFTPDAIQKFHKVVNAFGSMEDLSGMWQGVADLLSKGIAEHLAFGVTPDDEPWEPLSPMYAMKVGRNRMYIPEFSPIYDAYVTHPRILAMKTQLIYSPSGIPEIYHLALRGGWVTRRGNYVPGREWFGISAMTEERIGDLMQTYIEEKMWSQIK
jgi:hypothetical protein